MTYKKMVLLAVFFASLAAFGIYRFLQSEAARANVKQIPLTTVVVAKNDLPYNKVVSKDDVELKKVMVGDNHPLAFNDLKNVIGKVVIAKIHAGQQLLSSMVANKGDANMGLGFVVSEGMRAATVAINEVTGVGYMVKPGDRVDVLIRVSKRQPNNEDKVAATTLLQNVKVLAIGKNLGVTPVDEKSGDAKTVTLEVYPRDAEKIFLAAEDAKIMLTLRSPGDEEQGKVSPVMLDELYPFQSIAAPPSIPAPPPIVKLPKK